MRRIWLAGLTGALIVAATSVSVSRADFVEYTFEKTQFTLNEQIPFGTGLTSAPNIGDPTFSASFIKAHAVGPDQLISNAALPPLSGQFLLDRGGGDPVFAQFNQPVYGLSVDFVVYDPVDPNYTLQDSFQLSTLYGYEGQETVSAQPESGYHAGTLTFASSTPFEGIEFEAENSPTHLAATFAIDNLILYTTPYVAPTPEPSSLALAGLGIASLGGYARRRKPAC
jgi:hypothetical protein